MLPFHNGVFRIAQKAKSPIAVVSVKGTDNVNKNIPLKRTTVSFDVLAIIEPEEQSGLRTNIIGDRVRSILEDGLK